MKKFIKKIIIAAVIILVSVLAVFSFYKPLVVQSYKLKTEEIIEVIYSTGSVVSEKRTRIKSNVAGTVIHAFFKTGQYVTKGSLLVQIDPSDHAFSIADAKASFQQSRANLLQAEMNLELLKNGPRKEDIDSANESFIQAKIDLETENQNFYRTKKLFEKNVVTKAEFQNSQKRIEKLASVERYWEAKLKLLKKGNRTEDIKAAKAAVDSAKFVLKQKKIYIDKTSNALKDYFVVSTISGFITEYNINQGDTLSIGSPIATIINSETFEIKTSIDEVDIFKLKKGQDALVSFDADSDSILKGHVVRIVPKVDEISKLFDVFISIDKPKSGITEGMTCTVNIVIDKRKGLTVPVSSVLIEDDKNYLWKINKDKRLEKINFVQGFQEGQKIEIKQSSLREGDIVVYKAIKELKEGKDTKIQEK